MALRTTINPYKLKASGDSISRDDLNTWKHVLLGFIRQNETWTQFLAGEDNATWYAQTRMRPMVWKQLQEINKQ